MNYGYLIDIIPKISKVDISMGASPVREQPAAPAALSAANASSPKNAMANPGFEAKKRAMRARHPEGLAAKPQLIGVVERDIENAGFTGANHETAKSIARLAAQTMNASERRSIAAKKTAEEANEVLRNPDHHLVSELLESDQERHIEVSNYLGYLRNTQRLSEATTTGSKINSQIDARRRASITEVIEPGAPLSQFMDATPVAAQLKRPMETPQPRGDAPETVTRKRKALVRPDNHPDGPRPMPLTGAKKQRRDDNQV